MFTCPNCNSNKVEIQTTEIGIVRWLSPKVSSDGIIESLGKNFKYQGGETLGETYKIICRKCGEVIIE